MSINKKNPSIIVQARTGSKRFPQKMLKTIGNKTVLEIILTRLTKCTKVNSVILATSDKKQDVKLINIAKKLNIKFYCGKENDLVDRYYHAALKFDVDPIVRFPGDNLLPCPKEIDKIISHYQKKNTNDRELFCSNIENFFNSKYPTGIGAEVFGFKSLKRIYHYEKNKEKREHIHKNFIDYKTGKPINKKKCEISTIKAPKKKCYPKIVLHIDYKKEYEELKEIFLRFNNVNVNIEKVLKFIDTNKNEFKYLYNC